MILSVSRRCDIPAHHISWFLNRLREGHVLVRNPMNPARVSRIPLSPDVVDAMVFWSKNPLPMLDHLNELSHIPYYIQFTLTPYGKEIEPNLPDKSVLLEGFAELARRIGPERMVWRYDPILLNDKYTADVHMQAFSRMAQRLRGCTDTCIVSFLDDYRCMTKRCEPLHLRSIPQETMLDLLRRLAPIAAENGMRLATCCEAVEPLPPNVTRSACIDPERIRRIAGVPLDLQRDKNQRANCGCVQSIDVGAYDTCPNGCLYCYATHSAAALRANLAASDPASPLLCSALRDTDIVTDRAVSSHRIIEQLSLFD